MLRGLFLVTILLVAFGCAYGNQHFVFAPQVIREGADENVVVSLHGVQGRVKVVASVVFGGQLENFEYDNKDATKPILIRIRYDRNNVPKEPGKKEYVQLIVTVTQAGKQIYQTKLKMLVIYVSGYLYVQTDRPIYRPQEIVRFRVAALTNSYVPDRIREVKVVVRIPLENVGISEKSFTMSEDDKFIEDTFALPEYPVYGIWSVEAKYEGQDGEWSTREFDVRPYVLPTFNVRVLLDRPYILVKDNMADQFITGKITSEYSYGKKVYGNYYIAAKLKRPNRDRAITFYQFPDSRKQARIRTGRLATTFSIKATTILQAFINGGDNPTFEMLKEEGATVTIEVSVTGQDDGTIESDKSMSLPFVDSPYLIKIDRMSKYFTRGTSFEIKADVLDSVTQQLVKDVAVRVTGPLSCGSLKCDNGQCCVNNKCEACREHLINSDENGQINFNINMDASDKPKTFKIETLDLGVDPENEASLEFTLHPYASQNVLQCSAKRKIATVGDGAFQIELRYLKAPTEFRYIISARGRFVASGCDQPQPNTIQHTMQITIRSDMVPSFRLFVYYMSGNEMVSNSLWVDVKDACKKEIKVTVPNEVLPGAKIEVSYEGSDNALIGVSAVDRAAYFLYGDSRLTRYSVFEGLNQYDRGCVREGGKDAKHVFEVAGFQVVSNAKPFLPKEGFAPCATLQRKKRGVSDEKATAVFEEVEDPECETDAKIDTLTDEDCVARAERVREKRGVNCSETFVRICKQTQSEKNFARSSARSAAGNAQRQKALATTRSNFEESMLWSTEMLKPDGTLTLNLNAKHSITTFEFDTVSMHPEDGFCVAKTQNMTIFKNVFIQLHVPYALKRREQAQIRVTLFNYASETQKLRLEVMTGKDICSHFPEGKFAELATVRILPNSAVGFNFAVLPLRIPKNGQVEISAKAHDSENRVLDHIRRYILVEPEGDVREIKATRTFDLRTQQSDEFTFNFTFPEKYVPGTRKCWLYPFSNFMGPIIQFDPVTKQPTNDIHSIIRMPGGCGEQTMLSMGPNIYAHKYLDAVGKMKPDSPEYKGSIEKMKSGFANELRYRCNCNPKVWSVFPRAAPSVWLNAYVNKVFAQAKIFHTTMDRTPICTSVGWLTTLQNADGSFQTGGRVYHQEMHGAVGSKLTLTAYVLLSLVESVSLCDDYVKPVEQAIMKAIAYLQSQAGDDQMNQPYAIALVAYAMTIADTDHAYSKAMRAKLLTQFQYSDDNRLAFLKGAPLAQIQGTGTHAYWYRQKPLAIDVEATGYGLMALVFDAGVNPPDQNRFDLTRKIVLWLIEQRDERGGFTTTQDTVVGLQALADYMIWSSIVRPNQDKVNIDMTITSPPGTEFHDPPFRLHLDESNENVTNPIPVPPLTIGKGVLNIKAQGSGEGTISYRCVYRTLVDEESCHFDLAVSATKYQEKVNRGPDAEKPVLIKVAIKVSKPTGDPVGQSIVKITLLSGYIADENSLKRLSQDNFVDGMIERYEIANQTVVLYLREITKKEIFLAFLIKREIQVNAPQPAAVTVYHYYEPSISCTKFYALPNNLAQLRTTPCKDNEGQGSQDMCKCAEGGCMKCRTRSEQLKKTLCIPGLDGKCQLCEDPKQQDCFNLTKMACASSYVYVVNVTESVKDTTGVFVGFKARIETLFKRGPDAEAKSNVERNFVTRTDCYDSCKDDILKKGDSGDNDRLFKVPGRRMLMIGQEVDESVDRDGNPLIQYNLKEGDYAERIYDKEKCKKARKIINDCKKLKKKTKKSKERCSKNRAIDQSCTNLQHLRRMLIRGCDTP